MLRPATTRINLEDTEEYTRTRTGPGAQRTTRTDKESLVSPSAGPALPPSQNGPPTHAPPRRCPSSRATPSTSAAAVLLVLGTLLVVAQDPVAGPETHNTPPHPAQRTPALAAPRQRADSSSRLAPQTASTAAAPARHHRPGCSPTPDPPTSYDGLLPKPGQSSRQPMEHALRRSSGPLPHTAQAQPQAPPRPRPTPKPAPAPVEAKKKPFYRPRPLWLVPFAIVAALVRGMTLAPRVEVYTQLACYSLYTPQPSPPPINIPSSRDVVQWTPSSAISLFSSLDPLGPHLFPSAPNSARPSSSG
ncbi:hypothetical protein DFP72DRAFT_1063697 [Ephemerocybe angulata]|uniref:Uncharacterized protein n=1 Tax=Ephemerocybe angulata TaxID=980116 RepID=A0A8H6MCD7_9AGAR|nr:hypothetical protein DFP72DRAFT_1063697 [Tulosesus angulatus]